MLGKLKGNGYAFPSSEVRNGVFLYNADDACQLPPVKNDLLETSSIFFGNSSQTSLFTCVVSCWPYISDVYDVLECMGVKPMFMNGIVGDTRPLLVPDTYFIDSKGYKHFWRWLPSTHRIRW